MNDSSRAQATAEIKRITAGTDWAYIVQVCARIVWQATRLGLYAATAVMVYRAILAADAAGKLICAAVFLLLPTTNVRPAVPAEDPCGWMLALLYRVDTPDDLFPSLHCFNSWLCWAGLRGRKTVPAGYRAFSLAFALAVGLSTLTTRQHVIADVAAGFALAELCWQLAGHTALARAYGRIWERSAAVEI